MKRFAWVLVLVAGVGCSGKSTSSGTPGAAGSSGGGGTTSGGGGTGITGSSGSGGTAAMEPPSKNPVILSFTASPANLPAGGGMVTLTWSVQKATTLSIDQGVGTVTGTSKMVSVTATTIFTLTATNTDGMTTATTAAVIGQNPSEGADNRYVYMISPGPGQSFSAPATLRLFAAAHDPLIDTNKPAEGLGGNASKVQFFVDDQVVLEVDGANAEYWVFKGFASGFAAGTHRVSARGIFTNPDLVLDSPTVVVTVGTPTYDKTVTLTGDVMLTGSTGYELIGSADKRIKLDGAGHSIGSADGATGPLTLQFVDVYNLGDPTDTSTSAIDVTTSGAITIEDSIVDSSNWLNLGVNGAASIQRNTFRSNMRQPLGQMPREDSPGASYPALHISGTSTMPKTFASNNIGAGWVWFESASNWTVGGDTDAASNVAIGARAGIWAEKCNNMLIKRNYTHHVYYGGWSQGSNYELSMTTTMTVENNVIYDSSWPVRGLACEFRYNLVLNAGHEYLWADTGAIVHHNLFVGGQSDVASLYLLYNPTNVQVYNNTVDVMQYPAMLTALNIVGGSAAVSSNLFLNIPHPPGAAQGSAVTIAPGATLTSDYNAFAGPQTVDYSDMRKPAHDQSFADASGAMLTALPSVSFSLDEGTIWNRTTSVRDILMQYRMMYMPAAGSPLIDKGDPAGGAGNDVGCVGAGATNAADLFGTL